MELFKIILIIHAEHGDEIEELLLSAELVRK